MPEPVNEIQRRSRLLELLSTLIFSLLALAICVEAVMLPNAENPLAAAKSSIILRLPILFYLMAIWMMRQAFGALAKGALFNDVVPFLLKWIGFALSAGAFMTVFGVPILYRVVVAGGAGSIANFDPAAIAIGIVGLMLTILARLFAQAADIRSELEEFF